VLRRRNAADRVRAAPRPSRASPAHALRAEQRRPRHAPRADGARPQRGPGRALRAQPQRVRRRGRGGREQCGPPASLVCVRCRAKTYARTTEALRPQPRPPHAGHALYHERATWPRRASRKQTGRSREPKKPDERGLQPACPAAAGPSPATSPLCAAQQPPGQRSPTEQGPARRRGAAPPAHLPLKTLDCGGAPHSPAKTGRRQVHSLVHRSAPPPQRRAVPDAYPSPAICGASQPTSWSPRPRSRCLCQLSDQPTNSLPPPPHRLPGQPPAAPRGPAARVRRAPRARRRAARAAGAARACARPPRASRPPAAPARGARAARQARARATQRGDLQATLRSTRWLLGRGPVPQQVG